MQSLFAPHPGISDKEYTLQTIAINEDIIANFPEKQKLYKDTLSRINKTDAKDNLLATMQDYKNDEATFTAAKELYQQQLLEVGYVLVNGTHVHERILTSHKLAESAMDYHFYPVTKAHRNKRDTLLTIGGEKKKKEAEIKATTSNVFYTTSGVTGAAIIAGAGLGYTLGTVTHLFDSMPIVMAVAGGVASAYGMIKKGFDATYNYFIQKTNYAVLTKEEDDIDAKLNETKRIPDPYKEMHSGLQKIYKQSAEEINDKMDRDNVILIVSALFNKNTAQPA